MVVPFYSPAPTVHSMISFSPHPHQHLLFVVFCDDSHSGRCEMVSFCGFDVYFLITVDVERLSMCLLAISLSFGKMLIQALCPLSSHVWVLMLSCLSALCTVSPLHADLCYKLQRLEHGHQQLSDPQ